MQLGVALKADETNSLIQRGVRQGATSTSKLFQILIAGGAIYPMRIKRFVMVCFFGCAVLGKLACGADTNGSEACALPRIAQDMLMTKLPDWAIVSRTDLSEHDRTLWDAKHSRQCPGIAVGDYFGSGNPSHAVTLTNRHQTKIFQTLVVLRPHNDSYELIELSKPQEATRVLVVFKLKPGVFEDVETGEKVTSRSDAVGYEDIAAGMLVYAWHGGKFKEAQVSE